MRFPIWLPHFVPILRQRAASRQLKSVGKQMLGVLANLVTLGTAGNVIYGLNALKELHESNAILKEHQGTESLTAEATRAHDDKIEELLGYFTSLFGETDRTMAKVPAVLLFDDAQWADEDSLRFWRA